MNTSLPDKTTQQLVTTRQREAQLLAPWAMHSCDSAGRQFPEPDHPYRGPFQRDRDRILHSSAYRRLSGKMQVFTGRMGDYHRTRLTHTQEVATIARTIGRALRLNEDLIEALALMHDIGHPPYGHAGEDALNEAARDVGGFSHNQFALTIVQVLEVRYTETPGLNLTQEVLEGQTARVDKNSTGPRPLLEVQLVDASDSTTYDAHDTDDAVKLGLVSLAEMSQIPLIAECLEFVNREYTGLNQKQLRKAVVHRLIDRQVTDMLEHCGRELAQRGFQSTQEAMNSNFLIGPGPALAEQKTELEQFLHQRVYRHPELVKVREQAQARIRRMFDGFVAHPDKMANKYRRRADVVGVRRAVVEFIGGMTDHYCEQIFDEYFARSTDRTP
ncbi:MAG: dGTP triphosphohydrolase [Pirellulaceae bacterium]